MDLDTKITQGESQVHNLLDTSASCDKFGSIGSSLNGRLFLGICVNWCFVDHVNDTGNRTSSEHTVVQVGVYIVSENHGFSTRNWCVARDLNSWRSIYGFGPVKYWCGHITVVG